MNKPVFNFSPTVSGRNVPSFDSSNGSLLVLAFEVLSYFFSSTFWLVQKWSWQPFSQKLGAFLPPSLSWDPPRIQPGAGVRDEWTPSCTSPLGCWSPGMSQNQVAFYSPGHKKGLSLLQLKEKVQGAKHRPLCWFNCVSWRLKGRGLCLHVPWSGGELYLEEQRVGFSRFPKSC